MRRNPGSEAGGSKSHETHARVVVIGGGMSELGHLRRALPLAGGERTSRFISFDDR
jgi:hypothetical protein